MKSDLIHWLARIGLLVALCGCEGEPEVRWGHASTEPSSSFVDLLKNPNSQVTSFASVDALISAVQTEDVTFALLEQPPHHVEGLAIVTPIFPSVLHILVRKTLHDCSTPTPLTKLLSDKLIYAGSAGSTGYTLLEQLGAAEWLPPMSDLQVTTDAFGSQPDVYFQFGGLLPVDAVRRLEDYCLAPVGVSSDMAGGSWADAIGFRFPHLSAFVLPAGLYPRLNEEAVLTLAVTSILVTPVATDKELVYHIAQGVHDKASKLGELYPLADATIKTNLADQRFVLPSHPGAVRFALRHAPTILERYAELGALILTALIAISSASFAIYRLRRQTKKDRIDKFLEELLIARQALHEGAGNRTLILNDIQQLQYKVTQLVINERVQADSAYVAFLSLSNQILREGGEYQNEI